MTRNLIASALGALLVLSLVSCSKKSDTSQSEETAEPVADKATTEMPPVVEETKAPEAAETTPPPERHVTKHDPNATYTLSAIAMKGSYLKIDFSTLNPKQLNNALHRFMTENCTCGCPKDTIDECLVNDPQCQTVVTLANQVIREESMKGS